MSEYVVSTTIGDYIYTLDPKFRFGNVFPPVTTFPQTYNISESGYIAPFGSIIVDYETNSIHNRRLTINLFNGETSVEDSVIKVVYNGTDSITISKKSSPSGLGIQGYDVGGCAIGDESSYSVRSQVVDNTLSSYPDPLSNVPYLNLPVTSMSGCFSGCSSLTTPPVIPSSVRSMLDCFEGCTSLTTVPNIPSSVTNMHGCFKNCTSLTTAPEIPSGVTDMGFCFYKCSALATAPVIPSSVTHIDCCFDSCVSLTGDIYVMIEGLTDRQYCFRNTTQPIILHSMNENVDVCQRLASTANNGNVYVNIRPETPISFTDTQMNYMTNEGLKTLSLQTNANLVQCEIPDLVNGGTITTNVNDALIDLCNRNPISYTPVFEGVVTKSGVTFTNNGDGSFTVNGTAPTSEKVSQSILNIDVFPPAQYKMTGGYKQKDSEVSWHTGTYVTWKSAGGWGFSDSAQESATSFKSNVVSVNIRFEISAGQTVNNVTFTPVITKVGGA